MVMIGAGDVACAASSGATIVDRLMHRRGDGLVLAHAEIIVGAPNGDFLRCAIGAVARCLGKAARVPLKVGEDPITALFMQFIQAGPKKRFIAGSCGKSVANGFRCAHMGVIGNQPQLRLSRHDTVLVCFTLAGLVPD